MLSFAKHYCRRMVVLLVVLSLVAISYGQSLSVNAQGDSIATAFVNAGLDRVDDIGCGYTAMAPDTWRAIGQYDDGYGIWSEWSMEPIGYMSSGFPTSSVRIGCISIINQEGFWESSGYQEFFEYINEQPVGLVRDSDPRYSVTKIQSSSVDGFQIVVQKEIPSLNTQEMSYSRSVIYLWDGKRIIKVVIQNPEESSELQIKSIVEEIVSTMRPTASPEVLKHPNTFDADYGFLDSLKLPWRPGEKEPRLLTQDWDGHSAVGFALDFQHTQGGPYVYGTDILAPVGGTACWKYTSNGYGNYVDIDAQNGWQIRLAHMSDAGSGCRTVNTGDLVGHLGGTPNWPYHIHVEILLNWGKPDFGQISRIFGHPRNDFLYAPNKLFYSNNNGGNPPSSCPGPSLSSPSDGQTLSNRTVPFSWQGLSGCTFSGYTFRVKDTSNMDSGGSTIFDEGIGDTSITKEIPSNWENRDLYWGVRAANAPNGASWSVRRFRIEPNTPPPPTCSPSADQVSLYVDANYSGNCVNRNIGEYANPSAIGLPNDSISSIKVGSNVKAKLCRDDNYGGGCQTFDHDISNLSSTGGDPGDNSVSSLKVEPRVSVPGAPGLQSPSEGAVFNEGQSVDLSWTATGNDYYGELSGGPGDMSTFGWQSSISMHYDSLWAGYTYTWRVKARNSAGESGWSGTRTFTVKPAAPSNLSAQGASCTQVNLTWRDNAGSEAGQKIYRNGNEIASITAGVTSYQDTSAQGGTAYTYGVKAYRGSIFSDMSNSASVTTSPCAPDAPSPTSPANNSYLGSSAGVTFSWANRAGQSRVRVLKSGTVVRTSDWLSASQWQTSAFTAEGSYTWQVQNRNNSLESPWSSSYAFTIDGTPPPPLGVVSQNQPVNSWRSGVTSIDVTISRPGDTSGFKGYSIEWSRTSSTVPNTTLNQTESLVRLNAPADGEWWLHVRGVDNAGNWQSSAQILHVGPFRVDNSAPAITLIGVQDNTPMAALAKLTGAASDPSGGSGLNGVDAYIRRDSDNRYWTGTIWADSLAWLSASMSGTAWTMDSVPAWQSGETYALRGRATDRAGNVTLTPIIHVAIDAIAPSSSIGTPFAGGGYGGSGDLVGTATDNMGIAQIRTYLRRVGDGQFWNGSTWVEELVWLGVLLSDQTNDTWGVTSASWQRTLTGVTWIQGARYAVRTKVVDRAGNTALSSVVEFVYDTAPPSATVSNMANYGVVKSLSTLNGRAIDGSSGLQRVEIYLRRTADGLYWTGSAWQTALAWMSTVLENPTPGDFGPTSADWRRSLGAVSYVDGATYQARIRTWDRAGNAGLSDIFIFRIDTTAPTSAIISPASQSVINSFSGIQGTATDAVGIATVQVYLRRTVDGLYWNGSDWQDTAAWMPTALEITSQSDFGPTAVNWQRTAALPTPVNGETYWLRSLTTDKAGNTALSASLPFVFDIAPPQVTIAAPVVDGAYKLLDTLQGAAADQESDVTVVRSYIRRDMDSAYWDGTAWGQSLVWLNATLQRTGVSSVSFDMENEQVSAAGVSLQWSQAGNLPTWVSGQRYMVRSLALDKAGNQGLTPVHSFVFDTAAPLISVAAPVDGGMYNQNVTFTGSADDTISGVNDVQIYVRRVGDLKYWNGIDWQDDVFWLSTVLGTTRMEGDEQEVLPVGYVELSPVLEDGFNTAGKETNASEMANAISWRRSALPAWESQQEYQVRALVSDKANNTQLSGIHRFIYDPQAAEVRTTTPVDGSLLSSLAQISGTAVDTGSGVSSVQISIQRLDNNAFWGGNGWQSDSIWLGTSLDTITGGDYKAKEVVWRRGSALPTWSDNIRYRVIASVRDGAGNVRQGAGVEFFYDSVAPTVSIGNIANYAVTNAFPTIAGTATDSGSGLQRVEIYLRRAADGLYWTGTAWQAELVWLSSVLENPTPGDFGPTSVDWRRSLGAVSYVDGTVYQVRARSWDRAGNTALNDVISFRFDTTGPTSNTSTPADGSEVDKLPSMMGAATDDGGVREVQVYLRRESDGYYWNDSCWQSSIRWLATALKVTSSSDYGPAAVQWQHDVGNVVFGSGRYLLRVSAVDRAGNTGLSSVIKFTLLTGDSSGSVGGTCATYLPLITNGK